MLALPISTRVSRMLPPTVAALILLCAVPAASQSRLVKGQTIYVPAYSHVYHGDRQQPFQLAVTLSVRNTDLAHGAEAVLPIHDRVAVRPTF